MEKVVRKKGSFRKADLRTRKTRIMRLQTENFEEKMIRRSTYVGKRVAILKETGAENPQRREGDGGEYGV